MSETFQEAMKAADDAAATLRGCEMESVLARLTAAHEAEVAGLRKSLYAAEDALATARLAEPTGIDDLRECAEAASTLGLVSQRDDLRNAVEGVGKTIGTLTARAEAAEAKLAAYALDHEAMEALRSIYADDKPDFGENWPTEPIWNDSRVNVSVRAVCRDGKPSWRVHMELWREPWYANGLAPDPADAILAARDAAAKAKEAYYNPGVPRTAGVESHPWREVIAAWDALTPEEQRANPPAPMGATLKPLGDEPGFKSILTAVLGPVEEVPPDGDGGAQ